MKKLLLTIILVLALCGISNATGLTLWGLTEQISSQTGDDALTGRVGYMLGIDSKGSGLEPFIGSIWRVKTDDIPQVLTIGAVQHMPDLVDPNSNIPYIPDLFLSVMNEDVSIRPYLGAQCTINLVDRDSGFIGGIAGVSIMLTPESNSQLVFEISYDETYDKLREVADNEFKGYMGFRIPF